MSLTIYLAGFDVFRTDAFAQGERLKTLCAQAGHRGLYPLDKALPDGLAGLEAARWIYASNCALIHQADAVLANLNNFRGAEPDSGTAFEVGYAAALGKLVVGYLDDARPLRDQLGAPRDTQGYEVEDFGLARNLMLACGATLVQGNAERALATLGGLRRVAGPAANPL